jgi:acyl-CoA thioester hydrolase
MGVVHHSVYLKYLEDARVEYLHLTGLNKSHAPHFDYTLAVVKAEVTYLKPLKLLEEFEVKLRVLSEGRTSFKFEYEIYKDRLLCATGATTHVGLNSELKVVKPPKDFMKLRGNEHG